MSCAFPLKEVTNFTVLERSWNYQLNEKQKSTKSVTTEDKESNETLEGSINLNPKTPVDLKLWNVVLSQQMAKWGFLRGACLYIRSSARNDARNCRCMPGVWWCASRLMKPTRWWREVFPKILWHSSLMILF